MGGVEILVLAFGLRFHVSQQGRQHQTTNNMSRPKIAAPGPYEPLSTV